MIFVAFQQKQQHKLRLTLFKTPGFAFVQLRVVSVATAASFLLVCSHDFISPIIPAESGQNAHGD